ncbi:MAG: glutamine--fructose-6-phosphate transaminase (isomerizing) [Thermoprotei archaeon]
MGGIFGYVCRKPADVYLVKERLAKLTYRGYDSAGIAYETPEHIAVFKVAGNIDSSDIPQLKGISSDIALGHTRYASRGWPSIVNSHPMLDCSEKIAVVMDGIIDDYDTIKERLTREGHKFTSTTDAEILPHLLENQQDLLRAVLDIVSSVKGMYAFAFMVHGEKKIYAASVGQPIVIGLGDCNFVSSDVSSLTGISTKYAILPENCAVVVSADDVMAYDINGNPVALEFVDMKNVSPASKAGYEHYMLKEIYDVPSAMLSAVSSLMDKYLELAGMIVHGAKNVYVIGNGTSLHAGLISSYYFSDAGVDVKVVSAAEFPYYALNNVGVGSVIVAISQSGETSDVIRSVRLARQRGCAIIGVTNTIGSRLTSNSSIYLPMTAGPELAVPATKTFVATLVVLRLLAAYAGRQGGAISTEEIKEIGDSVVNLSRSLSQKMPELEVEGNHIADGLYGSPGAYVTSSGINFPVAMEGALKLKEAALVHAEGIQLGELLHGPIALASKGYPVITIKPSEQDAEELYDKIRQVVEFRGGKMIELSSAQRLMAPRELSPIVNSVSLQFAAYKLGLKNGVPVDTPPGLAKAMIM